MPTLWLRGCHNGGFESIAVETWLVSWGSKKVCKTYRMPSSSVARWFDHVRLKKMKSCQGVLVPRLLPRLVGLSEAS